MHVHASYRSLDSHHLLLLMEVSLAAETFRSTTGWLIGGSQEETLLKCPERPAFLQAAV